MPLSVEKIAQVCHEANRGYQAVAPSLGIPVAPPWDLLPGKTRAGIIEGVQGILDGKTPEQSHEGWLARKESKGWIYGPVKDEQAQTHPCIKPYADLDPKDQMKDHLFAAIVIALGASDSYRDLTTASGHGEVGQ